MQVYAYFFFFSSRRRHTRCSRDWSSDVCSSDLVRDDQPRAETAKQLALAIRDEVTDLAAAGIRVIQIDEPALREGLPLRRADWPGYLEWAVNAFRLATAGVSDATQIHTHMCYSEFNDVIRVIEKMD